MTFNELLEETLDLAFPEGRAENLEAVHRAFVVEALYDLQKCVPCYQINNTDTFPHCASYFNCGLTVIPKPPGQITSIYVIDRINPDTGLEDPTASEDWCTKVHYVQTDYCHLERCRRVCERCSNTSIFSVVNAIVAGLFGVWRRKAAYPKPDDVGFEALPKLPMGFHYPQTSTDADGRSPSGVWALHRGRIYIIPWIQSTETVVIEWDGIKRNWADSDLVEDDPKFKQAVRLHVMHAHAQAFGDNPTQTQQLHSALRGGVDDVGIIPTLISECNEENRIKRCAEAGTAGMAGAARGIGPNSGTGDLFYNDARVVRTANCPAGFSGPTTQGVREIGTVGSAISVADANARAAEQAQQEADDLLVCVEGTMTLRSAATQGHAQCPSVDPWPPSVGSPTVVSVLEGYVTVDLPLSSTAAEIAAAQVSLNAAAQVAADDLAESQLSCKFWNKETPATAYCPNSTDIAFSYTATVPKKWLPSESDTQAAADAKALVEAQNLAHAGLIDPANGIVCPGDPAGTFYNLFPKTATTTVVCTVWDPLG